MIPEISSAMESRPIPADFKEHLYTTIFLTSWIQGGNAYRSAKTFNPFDLKRSAGFGARVFLPMFGLLGFDYGWGFDKQVTDGKYGRFNIVLGFEPE